MSKTQASLASVIAYHELSKHKPGQYADSLGFLDWANQPDPFRTYSGFDEAELLLASTEGGPSYRDVWNHAVATRPINRKSVSQFLFYSLALSAWKQIEGTPPWSLRVNPSSGNLHPTEAYLIAGRLPGLSDGPGIYHYSALSHSLALRARLSDVDWQGLTAQSTGFFVALSSIHWRESWKYGVRAYRYCQLDLGHAMGALAFAASALGWKTCLTSVPPSVLCNFLGLDQGSDPERETASALLWVSTDDSQPDFFAVASTLQPPPGSFLGEANRLSKHHVDWPAIDEVHQAVRDADIPLAPRAGGPNDHERTTMSSVECLPLIRQRRSAVAMDGVRTMTENQFYTMMRAVTFLPANLDLFNGEHLVNLVLFVHRVEGVEPGLYMLVRDAHHHRVRQTLRSGFDWSKPDNCPNDLSLFRLSLGDARDAARALCCFQGIAADGCFSIGMLANFEHSLADAGIGYYPRLFWECGLIGQILYLEAESIELSATGIGCFHDDQFHDLLGLTDRSYQSLYHFTIGGAMEDGRVSSLAAYGHLDHRGSIAAQ